MSCVNRGRRFMTMTDPVADMLTRIRNALMRRRRSVDIPSSKMKVAIADVLRREGYIERYEVLPSKPQDVLRVQLKYDRNGEPVIKQIKRESKPGRRLYKSVKELPRVLNGLGIGIYSTSQGILSDRECRSRRVGGEYLVSVW